MRFGLGLPIFANPGVAYFRTPSLEQLEWPSIAKTVVLAEQLNLDSVWVADHMFLGRDGAILEGWTTLCAVAGMTRRLRIGTIHLGNGFRHPALTAKMAATLDFISDGRLEFFIDPGWRAREHIAYGFDWEPDRAVRVRQLRESLEICQRMWTGSPVTYEGEFYRLSGAICTPTPVQNGGPRIWLGEALDDESLRLIADKADVWNSIPASPALLSKKITRVDEACRGVGRDPTTLAKTLETQVLIYHDRREADELFERFGQLRRRYPTGDAMADVFTFLAEVNPDLDAYTTPEDFAEEWVMGTPDEVVSKLGAYRDLGVEEVICWFMDFPANTSMQLLATEVIPRLGAPVRAP